MAKVTTYSAYVRQLTYYHRENRTWIPDKTSASIVSTRLFINEFSKDIFNTMKVDVRRLSNGYSFINATKDTKLEIRFIEIEDIPKEENNEI